MTCRKNLPAEGDNVTCPNPFYSDVCSSHNKYRRRQPIPSLEFLTSSITKNIMAHNEAPGSFRTTSGYVRNTRPGPLLTTSDTCVCCSRAMWPSIENVTQPARRHVRVLTTQVIIASLQDKTPFLKDSSNDDIVVWFKIKNRTRYKVIICNSRNLGISKANVKSDTVAIHMDYSNRHGAAKPTIAASRKLIKFYD